MPQARPNNPEIEEEKKEVVDVEESDSNSNISAVKIPAEIPKKRDLKRVAKIKKNEGPWSEKETILLRQGMAVYESNYSKIAEIVETRTRE